MTRPAGGPGGPYRGVYEKRGRFRAVATTTPGKEVQVGTWATPLEAAIAVDRVTLYFGRDDLRLNLAQRSRPLGAASPEELRRQARAANKKTKSSQYVGVTWLGRVKMWAAYAHVTDAGTETAVHLGTYHEERDAAIAHDRFVLGVHGQNAQLNFPKSRLTPMTRDELLEAARRLKQDPRAGRYAGVTLRDWNTLFPWAAKLIVDGRALYLGDWRTPREAATAHDRAALYYLGPDAFLNLPKAKNDFVPASAAELRAEATQKRKRKTSSRYIGVSWVKRDRCWLAAIAPGGEYRSIGRFDDEKEAARARDEEAIRLFGDEARLNFHPRTGEELFGLRLRDVWELAGPAGATR